jgi:hypothetical protein
MKLRLALPLLLLATCISSPTIFAATYPANTPGRYAPRNECTRLPGAPAFRDALAAAVARRDVEALARLAAPRVKLDFGGGAGRNSLRRHMRGSEGSVRWRALSRLLPLGCAASHGELTLPWFFAQDLGDLDPFNVLLATGAKVAVYPRARASVKPVGQLAWQLVKPLASFDQTQAFQQVQLVGGALTGYVATAQLRSPVDYRLTATRTSGNWRITSFIAGD